MGRNVQDLCPDLLRRPAGGSGHDDGAATAAGSGTEGCDGSIALDDADVGEVHAELVGHDLGDRRLEALAVARRGRDHVDAAVQTDTNDSRGGREPTEG